MRSVLFVCMGNICRSPLAEGIARHRARSVGLDLLLDSAGTEAYHVGEAPDPRARALARARGMPIDDLRARQVAVRDFTTFDLILTADRLNMAALRARRPPDATAEIALLLPWAGLAGFEEVPDPYYGDERDFVQVFDLLREAMDPLLRRVAASA